jgi:hypothetical protein
VEYKQTETKLSIPVKAQSDLRSSDTQYPSNGQLLVRAGRYLPVALKIKDSVLKINKNGCAKPNILGRSP